MLQKSLSKTLANSNPETTQTTNNPLPLPPSVQVVIDEQFRQLYAQVIPFQAQLLPPRADGHLANVQRKLEQFEQQRQACGWIAGHRAHTSSATPPKPLQWTATNYM